MEWIRRTATEYETPNIYWIIEVFTGTKKDDWKPESGIKSWAQPVGALKDLIIYICKLKGALVFYHYRFPDEIKNISSGGAHKGWKYYLGVIHNTYHGGNIEISHRFI